jgi:hypothetical protein
MQSIQLMLNFSIYVVWYGFFSLVIFDCLIGLPNLMKQSFEPLPVQSIQPVNPQLMLPTEPKATKTERRKQSIGLNPSSSTELQVTKLTFAQVCIEFATVGLALERYRSGHYCYRVVFGYDSPCRFKTLQEAMDWLVVEKQSMQAVATS